MKPKHWQNMFHVIVNTNLTVKTFNSNNKKNGIMINANASV